MNLTQILQMKPIQLQIMNLRMHCKVFPSYKILKEVNQGKRKTILMKKGENGKNMKKKEVEDPLYEFDELDDLNECK